MSRALFSKENIFSALAITLVLSFSSCRSSKQTASTLEKKEPVKQEVVIATPLPVVSEKVEKKVEVKKETPVYSGMATYYHDKYQGKPTASGEPYDKNKYTASVRLNAVPLPFGTLVEVSNVKRNKKVIVKVNDIMGDNASSVIDLSYKAAEEIGLNIDGRTSVTIRVVEEDEK